MIKITSDTFDDTFCKIIENNVNFIINLYNETGIKTWLIPLHPLVKVDKRKDEKHD